MCVGLNQHPVYASAYQLQQATQAAIDKVIATYGQDAAAVLSRITYPPAYGSKAALQKLAMECVQSLQKQQQEKQQQEQQQKQQQQQQQQQQQKQQQQQQQQQQAVDIYCLSAVVLYSQYVAGAVTHYFCAGDCCGVVRVVLWVARQQPSVRFQSHAALLAR